ncbi:MAG: hypothetical protein FJZ01_01970 [Candidatus Sericytochromatia bacterium]|nr:hypothetical protein [Candidatus Tanganyikabacteria bacterium]
MSESESPQSALRIEGIPGDLPAKLSDLLATNQRLCRASGLTDVARRKMKFQALVGALEKKREAARKEAWECTDGERRGEPGARERAADRLGDAARLDAELHAARQELSQLPASLRQLRKRPDIEAVRSQIARLLEPWCARYLAGRNATEGRDSQSAKIGEADRADLVALLQEKLVVALDDFNPRATAGASDRRSPADPDKAAGLFLLGWCKTVLNNLSHDWRIARGFQPRKSEVIDPEDGSVVVRESWRPRWEQEPAHGEEYSLDQWLDPQAAGDQGRAVAQTHRALLLEGLDRHIREIDARKPGRKLREVLYLGKILGWRQADIGRRVGCVQCEASKRFWEMLSAIVAWVKAEDADFANPADLDWLIHNLDWSDLHAAMRLAPPVNAGDRP